MKRAVSIVLVTAFAVAGWLFWRSPQFQSWWYERTKPDLPVPEIINDRLLITNANVNTAPVNNNVNSTPKILPAEKNLAVPFTTQAPNANWDAEHEEFCEEAAVLMVGRYFQARAITDAADAEDALQQLKDWELDNLGFFKDTTAAETAQILGATYPVTTTLLTDPTSNDLKTDLAAGHLIIVPTAGRQLHNPNFKQPGPIYHMVVLKGYTKTQQFITNDPGTRKGADYIYSMETIMTAMHDWNSGDVDHGGKVVIVIEPRQ